MPQGLTSEICEGYLINWVPIPLVFLFFKKNWVLLFSLLFINVCLKIHKGVKVYMHTATAILNVNAMTNITHNAHNVKKKNCLPLALMCGHESYILVYIKLRNLQLLIGMFTSNHLNKQGLSICHRSSKEHLFLFPSFCF